MRLCLPCSPFNCVVCSLSFPLSLPHFPFLSSPPQMVKVLFNHDFAVPAVPTPAQSLRKQPLSPEEQERANARAYVKKQRFEVFASDKKIFLAVLLQHVIYPHPPPSFYFCVLILLRITSWCTIPKALVISFSCITSYL